MRQEDYRLLLDALLPSVLAAGRIEMAHFKAGVTVETKADTTPVTIADHEADRYRGCRRRRGWRQQS